MNILSKNHPFHGLTPQGKLANAHRWAFEEDGEGTTEENYRQIVDQAENMLERHDVPMSEFLDGGCYEDFSGSDYLEEISHVPPLRLLETAVRIHNQQPKPAAYMRVMRGVERLDDEAPNWADKVEAARLESYNPLRGVMHHVFGSYKAATERLGLDPARRADVFRDEGNERWRDPVVQAVPLDKRDAGFDGMPRECADNDEHWKRVVRTRQLEHALMAQ